jgi:hypothetical protein
MDGPALYDSDILAWSEQQAAALRRLAARRDLPNDLDLENVVEEIESVGRAQREAVESFIELILLHIAKAVSEPDAPSLGHWRTECVGWQVQLSRRFTPSMRSVIDMNKLWRDALRQAEAALEEHGRALSGSLGRPCPVSIDDLLSNDFDFRATVERLADAVP